MTGGGEVVDDEEDEALFIDRIGVLRVGDGKDVES